MNGKGLIKFSFFFFLGGVGVGQFFFAQQKGRSKINSAWQMGLQIIGQFIKDHLIEASWFL